MTNSLLAGACFLSAAFVSLPIFAGESTEQDSAMPNVVFIFADDMGYGEVQALNPKWGKIPTPHLDKLVAEGMTFTDAHTTSSVCTPSRYGLLTGRYNWRTTLQTFVLGDNATPLIAEDRMTLGHLFREQGYHSAIFGKWHLGFNNVIPAELADKAKPRSDEERNFAPVPVGAKTPNGPITRGFDTFFGWQHARSMASLIEGNTYIEEVKNVEVLPRLNKEVCAYIDAKAADAKAGKPFFIYLPLSSPHAPIVPAPEWKGKGGLGDDYSDFIAQTDGSVGEVVAALERNGLSENTILIFSADNGSSGNRASSEAKGHRSHAHLRGSKGGLYEGGHRVPFIVRWPAEVKAGSVSNQLVSLSDMMETFSELFKIDLPDDAAEDSISFLPALYGKPVESPRIDIVHHSKSGHFSIRQGDWKLLLQKEKAGKTMQLYNLRDDIGEQNNLLTKHPEKIESMIKLLEKIVADGRSTPGTVQKNDAEIDIWKLSAKKR